MIPIPLRDYVLCEQITKDSEETEANGIVFRKENLKVYKIIDVSKTLDSSRFKVGDKIICNATGTMMNLDGSRKYLFNIENIAGKIEE